MAKVKICGLRRPADIAMANQYKPDYIGFVFAKSKRQVNFETAQQLKALLAPKIQVVGVFVNHDIAEIAALLTAGIIDVVQLHGSEPEATLCTLKEAFPTVPIIKAIRVQSAEDILAWERSCADYLLLDNGSGGTGKPFDWAVLPTLSSMTKPYFIAGGLTCDNVNTVLSFSPYGVDVSGGVEDSAGGKDPNKVSAFIQTVRKENAK